MRTPRLVCLVPARNCEDDLPDYFRSVERFADAVVALDDGSTDATRETLAGSPLVARLLTNPPRAGYAAWDDAANRARLFAAAAQLEPDWIISLDADERIPVDDAVALRRFLRDEARPGWGYCLRCYRMVGGVAAYDASWYLSVGRLFAYEPGQTLPRPRLHFVPIPVEIPRTRWVETTLRIQHLAGITQERRAARFAKYLEADPDRRWQSDYSNLLRPPGEVRAWTERPADLPVLPSNGHPQGRGTMRLVAALAWARRRPSS